MNKKLFVMAVVAVGLVVQFFCTTKSYKEPATVGSTPALTETVIETPAPTFNPFPTSTPGVAGRAIQKFARSEILTTSVNGIEMSATNFRLEKNVVNENIIKLDLCFQYPDNRGWIISEGVIWMGDNKFLLDQVAGLELTRTSSNGQKEITIFPSAVTSVSTITWHTVESDGLPDYRCDIVSFRIRGDTRQVFPLPFKMVIEKIDAFPNEGEGCYEHHETVQAILDSKASGIKIGCEKSHNQFTFSRFVVIEKPATISEEEAKKQISKAYEESYTLNGPWVFEGNINK